MLERELENVLKEFVQGNAKNANISSASVYWHIEHLLKVINGVTKLVSESKPDEYKSQWSWTRFYIFLRGKIPRGVGKSPSAVLPSSENGSQEEVRRLLNKVVESLKTWGELSEKKWFDHPYFGPLKKNKSAQFLKIHTNHHLAIIRDIRRKR